MEALFLEANFAELSHLVLSAVEDAISDAGNNMHRLIEDKLNSGEPQTNVARSKNKLSPNKARTGLEVNESGEVGNVTSRMADNLKSARSFKDIPNTRTNKAFRFIGNVNVSRTKRGLPLIKTDLVKPALVQNQGPDRIYASSALTEGRTRQYSQEIGWDKAFNARRTFNAARKYGLRYPEDSDSTSGYRTGLVQYETQTDFNARGGPTIAESMFGSDDSSNSRRTGGPWIRMYIPPTVYVADVLLGTKKFAGRNILRQHLIEDIEEGLTENTIFQYVESAIEDDLPQAMASNETTYEAVRTKVRQIVGSLEKAVD